MESKDKPGHHRQQTSGATSWDPLVWTAPHPNSMSVLFVTPGWCWGRDMQTPRHHGVLPYFWHRSDLSFIKLSIIFPFVSLCIPSLSFAFYCVPLHSTAFLCILLCSFAFYCVPLHSIVFLCILLCSFAFYRVPLRSIALPSWFHPISSHYLVHLRDIFTHFSYGFVCLLPFIPSLPVTFLGFPFSWPCPVCINR